MSLQTVYTPAKKCSSGPTQGAKALMSWWLGAYQHLGAKNLGIYNCRNIDGSDTLSLHGEGRAADLGCPVGNGWAFTPLESMRLNSKELGVQLIIYNRHVWSARRPHDGWRPYTGSNPHTDHAHVEITPEATQNLTVAHINMIMGGATDLPAQLPTLRRGAFGVFVKRLQALLNVANAGVQVDGMFGNKTDAAVRHFQYINNVRASVENGNGDGEVGPYTWRALLGLK